MSEAIKLGVNIDHVATVRQARGEVYPDPAQAAQAAIAGGADSITIHLREDRRHIQDHDAIAMCRLEGLVLNLEMAATNEMLAFAQGLRPAYCCVVPEKREELTTEGGLDVVSQVDILSHLCDVLQAQGSQVSLFVDADEQQLEAAKQTGARMVEIHTGHYANAHQEDERLSELNKIRQAADYAADLDFQVNAGHGLNYGNVMDIAAISPIVELNIGHAIVARALMVGMETAVREMKSLMQQARS